MSERGATVTQQPPPAEQGSPRPAIVTVDDDPGVSRAVARDLRRKYGEGHRIVRAESGAAGLDALRQMKLRGDLVAVILADYRMPQARAAGRCGIVVSICWLRAEIRPRARWRSNNSQSPTI